MDFYCYILYSQPLDRYYIGQTNDLENRINQHNSGSNRFTSKGIPWIIVRKEKFNSRLEAIQRENEIKRKKSRKYIEFLIASS